MKRTFRREAPAKINLALDILGKRPDGYHELRSVMQTVSLCDSVELAEGGEGFTLSMAGFTPPEGRKTLEQRAAEAFFARTGRETDGLEIFINKRIPMQAGLGGGSADASSARRSGEPVAANSQPSRAACSARRFTLRFPTTPTT